MVHFTESPLGLGRRQIELSGHGKHDWFWIVLDAPIFSRQVSTLILSPSLSNGILTGHDRA
jgi:hypothetical protein